ncbi:hypothetical protein XELAEV_18035005mg [Xenopus laevis]|uniref:Glycoprotein n=1 Tax=Xenopus laevis TaxID=8355 RepID=A0A974CEW4_XENLA|nr:hypothetical protein XELAEV_18035005mg [Xenopus laevis]
MPSQMITILYAVLILGKELHAERIVMPGPSSGIMLQDTAGFIMSNKRILSQKIYMSIDPCCIIERQINVSNIRSPEIQTWYQLHIEYSQERITQILEQTRKTLIREPFLQTKDRNGNVFATGVRIANSASLKILKESLLITIIVGWLTVITNLAIRWMKIIKKTLDKLWLKSRLSSLHNEYDEGRV